MSKNMKREKKTPVKVKSRKSSTSSGDSSSVIQNEPTVSRNQQQRDETRVLVEECNDDAKQANVTVQLQNADSLAKYRNKNPHIKIQNPKTTTNFTFDEISDDDEIWICNVPDSIDINKFVGESIKLGSKKSIIKTEDGEIEYNSSKYDRSNGVYQNSLTLIAQKNDGQFSVKNITPIGRIMFHQKIAKSEESIELTPSGRHECTLFPENLVVRHPLLGRNFEDKIAVSKTIQKNLNEAQIASEQGQSTVRVKQEREENDIASPSSPKKTKKRRAEPVDSVSMKKPKEEIKTENGVDDDLDRIKQIFGKSN